VRACHSATADNTQTATRNREKWEATWRSASTAKCCRILYARSFAARRIAIKRSYNSFAREPKRCTFRERACLLKIAATGKISISRKFVDVYRQNRVLYSPTAISTSAQILFLSLIMWHATSRIPWENTSRRVVTQTSIAFSLSDVPLIRDNANLLILFKQDG